MSKVLITDTHLSNIGNAIRSKLGVQTTYKPGDMPAAIMSIPSVLGVKNISTNGTYEASDDGLDGYSSVIVNVPNTYTQNDEGKVVSSGALVAQNARESTITQNGTYDTTNNNVVVVAVDGGNSVLTPIEPFGQSLSLAQSSDVSLQSAQKYTDGWDFVLSVSAITGHYEGCDLLIANLEAGLYTVISFKLQFSENTTFFSNDYDVGCRITDSANTQYTNSTHWSNNIPRDTDEHTYTFAFVPVGTSTYLSFNFSGVDDGTVCTAHVSDFTVAQSRNEGKVVVRGGAGGADGAGNGDYREWFL